MAGRTSQASRRRAARDARAEVARTRRAADKRLGVKKNAGKSGASFGAAMAAGWMAVTHGIGWLARAAGRRVATARNLDREHRRDGGGLLLLGLALITAVAVWFGGAGPVGAWLAGAIFFCVGAIAMALPLLLLVGGLRLMRSPDEQTRAGRGLVGWSALLVGCAGVLHLAKSARPIRR